MLEPDDAPRPIPLFDVRGRNVLNARAVRLTIAAADAETAERMMTSFPLFNVRVCEVGEAQVVPTAHGAARA